MRKSESQSVVKMTTFHIPNMTKQLNYAVAYLENETSHPGPSCHAVLGCNKVSSGEDGNSYEPGSPETDLIEVLVESKAISQEVLHRLVQMTSDVGERVALVRIHLASEENAVLGQSFHPEHGVSDVDVV